MDKDIETGSCQSRVADSDNTSNLIHIARGGGGRGTHTHVDGDFHCAHRNKAFLKEDSKNDYPDLDVSVGKGGGGGSDFVAISWNACGMEQGAVDDLAELLESDNIFWDVVLIQEGPAGDSSGCTIIEKGHALYIGNMNTNERTVCILLHRRWLDVKLSFHAQDARIAFLDLYAGQTRLRLTTAHLPHALFDDEAYDAVLSSLEEVAMGARRLKSMNMIGLDANAVLGRGEEADDGNIIGGSGYGGRRSWTCLCSLVAWSTPSRSSFHERETME